MGDVDRDLAPVVAFPASDGSRYMNGQIICVNGGATMVRWGESQNGANPGSPRAGVP